MTYKLYKNALGNTLIMKIKITIIDLFPYPPAAIILLLSDSNSGL